MTRNAEELMTDLDGRRAFEEELLIGDVTDTLGGLLRSLKITQKQLASRLGVTEGRISQMLAGSGNLTLRSLAAAAWALGLRFELTPRPVASRRGTPAEGDGPLPAWLQRMSGTPIIEYHKDLRVPDSPSPVEVSFTVPAADPADSSAARHVAIPTESTLAA